MTDKAEKHNLEEALHRLQADREAVPWTERRELVASLAEAFAADPKSESALALVQLLADDPKPEVRKEIADLLILVPQDDFAKLAARLSANTSSLCSEGRSPGDRSSAAGYEGIAAAATGVRACGVPVCFHREDAWPAGGGGARTEERF